MSFQHKCMTVTWSKTHFRKYGPERIDIQVIEGAIRSEVFQGMGLRSHSNLFNTSRQKQFWDVLSYSKGYFSSSCQKLRQVPVEVEFNT